MDAPRKDSDPDPSILRWEDIERKVEIAIEEAKVSIQGDGRVIDEDETDVSNGEMTKDEAAASSAS